MSELFGGPGDGLDGLKKLFSEISGQSHGDDCESCGGGCKGGKNDPATLKAAFDRLGVKYELKPGMLVKWKDGLKNRSMPAVGAPAIVVEKLTEAVFDPQSESGGPYFREPLDIILGVMARDGEFICYHYDSRRFEPFE